MIKDAEKDWLSKIQVKEEKLSRSLADRYSVIVVEDLDMKAMSQCLKFGKSVMDNGNGQFISMLEYKLREKGGRLVKIDRFFPSSKQ